MTVESYITSTLNERFSPSHLQVENESHMHNVPANSETHFKVVMASTGFDGVAKVKRHQAVYAALSEALNNGVHALALHLYTPAEWQARQSAPQSPQCMGGSKA